ncbi:MAG: MauE/DoxX family redox-associated membrane protein [Solirubrobacteraceae bacterium]
MIHGAARSVLLVALEIAIGSVWIVAAIGKLRSPAATRQQVQRLVGAWWVAAPVAALLAPAELALGVALIAGWHTRIAAAVSAALFAIFAGVIATAAIRGALDGGGCGCFGARSGSARARSASVTAVSLVAPRVIARNLVLAWVALALAGWGDGPCRCVTPTVKDASASAQSHR